MENVENGNGNGGGPERILNQPIDDNDRSMMDFIIPVLDELDPSIAQPVNGLPFKLEPVMFTMLQNMWQCHGLLMEDPHKHLRNFIEVANTFRNPNISDDALRLKLFLHSLADKAKEWLNSLPSNSITNWHTLAEKFIMKFLPSNKIVQTRCDITNFMQKDGETLVDVWERSFNQAYELLEQMTQNYAQWPDERNQPRRVAGLHEVDSVTALSAKFDALSTLVETQGQPTEARLSQPQVPIPQPQVNAANTSETCVFFGGPHLFGSCPSNPESVYYVGNRNRNHNNFSNNFNQGWRQNQQPHYFQGQRQQAGPSNAQTKPTFPPQNYQQPPRQKSAAQSSVPYYQNQSGEMSSSSTSSLEALLREYLVKSESKQNSLEAIVRSIPASLRNLESQLGHLANALNSRPPGTLPSNTEEPGRNNEQCHMIELRNGRSVNQPEAVIQVDHPVGTISKENLPLKGQATKPNVEALVVNNRPPPPFPQRLQKLKQEHQFRKFLDLLKQLFINIPFVDALEQMPTYVKFMKEILSRKRRLEEFETVALRQEISQYLLSKIPPKLGEPGNFTIPCTIGDQYVGKALCDLGASINLMPMSVFKKLKVGEPSPTIVTLQLADRSLVYPEGKIEKNLVKVDKFILPADFIILYYEGDMEVPIILGRAFLATGGAVIDVKEGELSMNVNGEQVKFNILKSLKYPRDLEECSMPDVIDHAV
ncbi:uncharacterized protein LOC133284775 [Gastrolobium bilobum]|uniref:uncharacterized protein LOC133284775 n=1 Tax=Gastrolobium bilobum TaxID=150636 RepID=UPI002AB1A0D1|nr:uncharacterized protein LOC133284775 [Gastrolobium bilobum]